MKHPVHILYRRFLNKEATDEEIVRLLDYFDTATTQELQEWVHQEWPIKEAQTHRQDTDEVTTRVYQTIVSRIQEQQNRASNPTSTLTRLKRRSWRRLSAAAILLVTLFLGYSTWQFYKKDNQPARIANKILPGTNRATLTMADGRNIDLSSEQSGIIVGKDITYLDGSQVLQTREIDSLMPTDGLPDEDVVLATPRGGMYQITLSDGTKAWLNAASTLTYPTQFNDRERVVELSGEAYFEVEHLEDAQGNRIPFFVKTAQQTVEVLGTRFNLAAYPEEPNTKTTLIEGSVRLLTSAGTVLTLAPGEEAQLIGQNISKYTVDQERAAAWKEGYFVLNDNDVATFMRQLARWYDIEIEYDGTVPNRTLSGKISRKATLDNVIEMLGYFDLTCKINNRTLIIGSMVKPLK